MDINDKVDGNEEQKGDELYTVSSLDSGSWIIEIQEFATTKYQLLLTIEAKLNKIWKESYENIHTPPIEENERNWFFEKQKLVFYLMTIIGKTSDCERIMESGINFFGDSVGKTRNFLTLQSFKTDIEEYEQELIHFLKPYWEKDNSFKKDELNLVKQANDKLQNIILLGNKIIETNDVKAIANMRESLANCLNVLSRPETQSDDNFLNWLYEQNPKVNDCLSFDDVNENMEKKFMDDWDTSLTLEKKQNFVWKDDFLGSAIYSKSEPHLTESHSSMNNSNLLEEENIQWQFQEKEFEELFSDEFDQDNKSPIEINEDSLI